MLNCSPKKHPPWRQGRCCIAMPSALLPMHRHSQRAQLPCARQQPGLWPFWAQSQAALPLACVCGNNSKKQMKEIILHRHFTFSQISTLFGPHKQGPSARMQEGVVWTECLVSGLQKQDILTLICKKKAMPECQRKGNQQLKPELSGNNFSWIINFCATPTYCKTANQKCRET